MRDKHEKSETCELTKDYRKDLGKFESRFSVLDSMRTYILIELAVEKEQGSALVRSLENSVSSTNARFSAKASEFFDRCDTTEILGEDRI